MYFGWFSFDFRPRLAYHTKCWCCCCRRRNHGFIVLCLLHSLIPTHVSPLTGPISRRCSFYHFSSQSTFFFDSVAIAWYCLCRSLFNKQSHNSFIVSGHSMWVCVKVVFSLLHLLWVVGASIVLCLVPLAFVCRDFTYFSYLLCVCVCVCIGHRSIAEHFSLRDYPCTRAPVASFFSASSPLFVSNTHTLCVCVSASTNAFMHT